MEINIQTVGMTYPNGKQALKGLSLDLRSPSLVGLLGPNGAGKSTLMKLLVAALLPTTGSILVDGQPLTRVERQLKARLGYLPQDFGLFDELTVEQFLDYMAALKGLRGPRAVIRQVIRSVNLEEKARAKIRTLSGGQRQRVGIAQALLGDPELLILHQGGGLGRSVPVSSAVSAVVGASDGELTVGQIVAAVAMLTSVEADDVRAEVEAPLRDLIRWGFLTY